MAKYLLRRILWSTVTLFLFVSLIFFLVQVIIPHDFTVQFALGQTQAQREALQHELGLDLPLWKQYLRWMRNFVSGSLGESFYGYTVEQVLKTTVPLSLFIFLIGTALAFTIGLWLGKITGWRGSGPLASTLTFGGIALYTTFPPWLAFLMTHFISRRFSVTRNAFARSDGLSGLSSEIWGADNISPSQIAWRITLVIIAIAFVLFLLNLLLRRLTRRSLPGFVLLLLTGLGVYLLFEPMGIKIQAVDLVQRATLPVLTYTLLSFGETMLIMRTSMTDTLKQEYVYAARAKGLPNRMVRDKHAARNALLPVVGRLIISLPYLLTGMVIIEDVLVWPGVGEQLWTSLYQQDMPVVMVLFLMIGIFSLIARLFVDVAVAILDPRIRFDGTASEPAQL